MIRPARVRLDPGQADGLAIAFHQWEHLRVFSWLRRLLDPEHRFTDADRRRQLNRYSAACDELADRLGEHGMAEEPYRYLASMAQACLDLGWSDEDLGNMADVPSGPAWLNRKMMHFGDVPAWQQELGSYYGAVADAALDLRATGQAL